MKNRNSLSSLKKNYLKIPNRIFEIGLSPVAVSIYGYMAKVPENFNPSVSNICKTLTMSRGTAVKYMKELKDRNIIKVIKPGYENNITEYEFCSPKDWR